MTSVVASAATRGLTRVSIAGRWWLDRHGPAYASQVTPDDVGRYAESLPQVKRKGSEARPAWYVHDRLVVRLQDQDTVVIRVPLSKREHLLESYPDSFGVPPRMEAHHKVEAYLDRAQPAAVRAAIDLAWEMQRDRLSGGRGTR